MQDALLLYSFQGYVLHGVKRALIRQLDALPARVPALWRLLGQNGTVLSGALTQPRQAFGCTVWPIDFTEMCVPGEYRISVTFSDGSSMSSERFPVCAFPFLRPVSLRLSIQSAKARMAVGKEWGGYFDCNSQMGEAYSHGAYLNGLCTFYSCHQARLSESEKANIHWAAQVAFDYLMRLYQPETGAFINAAPERVFDPHNFGIHDTVESVYGLSAYMDVFRHMDERRVTRENHQKLLKSICYAKERTKDDPRHTYQFDEWLPPVCCHLYQAFGDEELLNEAVQNVMRMLKTMDLRRIRRGGVRSMSFFEGMWMLQALRPEITAHPDWIDKLSLLTGWMQSQVTNNAYQFQAPSDMAYAMEEWEHPERMLHGRGDRHWLINADMLRSSLDACYLALLTGSDACRHAAAGGLYFVTGLHFGLPRSLVNAPTGKGEWVAASFIANIGSHAKPWKTWYFTMLNDEWASVVNGYTIREGQYFYTDEDWVQGETFIKSDGMMLCAASLYECLCGDVGALNFTGST